MNRTILSALTTLTLTSGGLCGVAIAPACVISGTDNGDDGNADESGSGGDDSGSASASASDSASASVTDSASASATATDSASATDSVTATATETATETVTDSDSASTSVTDSSADESETGNDTGVDVDPQEGPWLYDESGGTTNDCTFLANPSNGFGTYLVAITAPGVFTIAPGDGTEPFECDYGGGTYDCPERLQGDVALDGGTGADATGHVFVALDGALQSSTEMSGEQHGRIECEGADCGLAEQYLRVTFPCEFTIPFTGTAQ